VRGVESKKVEFSKQPLTNSFLMQNLVKGMVIRENKGMCGKSFPTEQLVGQVDDKGNIDFTNTVTKEKMSIAPAEFSKEYAIQDVPHDLRINQKITNTLPHPKNEEPFFTDITKKYL